MRCTSTDAAFAAVRAAEPASLSRDDSERLLGEVRRLRSWLDTVEMSTVRRLRALERAGHAEAPETLIAGAGGCTGRDAKDVTDRTDLCDEAPTLEEALVEGDATSAHLDAISSAAKGLPDDVRAAFLAHSDDLLARAKRVNLDTFRRECRRLAKHLLAMSRKGSDVDELEAQRDASTVRRWVDRQTGMHHTHLELDPVRDAKLNSAFTAELARLRALDGNAKRSWQQLQVDAFVNAITGVVTPTKHDDEGPNRESDGAPNDSGARPPGGRRVDRVPEATILVDWTMLVGAAETGTCETENGVPIPVATARRLCCDAEVLPVVLGGRGEVLDQGRSARTATVPQRRALRAMHRGCVHPDCGVGFDACRIHHVEWWWRDAGPTDIGNLLPVCERHHHLVHEGGWSLALADDAERTATWTRPDGVVHHVGSTIDRTRTPDDRPRRLSEPFGGRANERR